VLPSTTFSLFFAPPFWSDIRVPRKLPLAQREIDIGRRLRKARQALGCSRGYLALHIGVASSAIKRIELGRVPLRYSLGARIIGFLRISAHWLATGIGDMHFPYPAPDLDLQGQPEALFSYVFDTVVHPQFSERQEFSLFSVMAIMSKTPPQFPAGMDANFYFQNAIEHLQDLFDHSPQEIRGDLVQRIIRAASGFSLDHTDELEKGYSKLTQNKLLTRCSLKRKYSEMHSEFERLILRLKRATRKRGSKARLALELNVKLPRVSEWLSCKKEPGGNTTLRLLNWVERAEAEQTKNPDRASTRPGQKTQPRKSSYEKPKSNQSQEP
jgi:transcriptional regulator with XRE-family HTH domain